MYAEPKPNHEEISFSFYLAGEMQFTKEWMQLNNSLFVCENLINYLRHSMSLNVQQGERNPQKDHFFFVGPRFRYAI